MLHFHSHNANIVVERFPFGKLANVADDAVKKFLGGKASVASDGSVQLVLREECAGSISTSNNPSVKSMTRSPLFIGLLDVT